MSKFKIIIPARMGSTRLKNKMLANINGLPLIIRTANQALKSKAIEVYVATDHDDIIKMCDKYNIKSILTSVNLESGTERVYEASKKLKLKNDEIIINLQGDEPLIEPNAINELANFMIKNKSQVATIAHEIYNIEEIFNPNNVKVVIDKNNNAIYFSRAPIPYYRDLYNKKITTSLAFKHMGIYAFKVGFLKKYINLTPSPIEKIESLEQLRIIYHGFKIGVIITNQKTSLSIDTKEDLKNIKKILK